MIEYLSLGPRPKVRSLSAMQINGVATIVTLLRPVEGSEEFCNHVRLAGMKSVNIPLSTLEGALSPLDQWENARFEVSWEIRANRQVYMHCAAGIHRTSIVALMVAEDIGMGRLEAWEWLKLARGEVILRHKSEIEDRLERLGLGRLI